MVLGYRYTGKETARECMRMHMLRKYDSVADFQLDIHNFSQFFVRYFHPLITRMTVQFKWKSLDEPLHCMTSIAMKRSMRYFQQW